MSEVERLYKNFKPRNYKLLIKLDKAKKHFSGFVIIAGKHKLSETILKLHSKDLDIMKVSVDGSVCKYSLDPKNDLLNIKLPINKTNLEVTVSFKGEITKPMHGLYPCSGRDGSTILATQFESHHAREVFPCIDEPEAKATFDFTLVNDESDVALSNMSIKKETIISGLKHTEFDTTPVMSTYLLAFVSGPLLNIKSKTSNGTEVRVWATKDHDQKSLKFALDTSVKTIEFFNDYFGVDYPLPKCDQVALPDFSSGAMENWGLITYREVCLLVDPKTTSITAKEYVATVIAHELSHQWFGNLVTMKWWNDLWLNESFATLMEYIAVDAIYPEWDVMLSFAAHEGLAAMSRDSIPGVQSVKCDVTHPDQISTLFDPSIVYAKGARLLLMAYNYIGKSAFQKGLKDYFINFAYKNTEGNDLWDALNKSSKKDIKSIMNQWITSSGFPIIKVNQKDKKLAISQERFLISGPNASKELWKIPLDSYPKISKELLSTKSIKTSLADSKYVRFNTSCGHYSVLYETQAQKQYIEKLVRSGKISASKRLFILNDSLMQAKAGYSSITDTLDLLSAYKLERQEPVWTVMAMCIADARKLIEDDEIYENLLKNIIWDLVKTEYANLGWVKRAEESSNTIKLRGIILGLATYTEKPDIIKAVLKQFEKYKSTDKIPADIRPVILGSAVRFGNKHTFDDLIKEYPLAKNADLQQDICSALTSSRNEKQIAKLLNLLKNDNFVRLQDVDRWIIYLLRNKYSRQATWNWLTNNWSWIEDNFKTDKSYDNYPRYAASAFATKQWLKRYVKFFKPLSKEVALQRNIELGIADISAKADWQTRDKKQIINWLDNYQSKQ
jgi:aminopeptidase N